MSDNWRWPEERLLVFSRGFFCETGTVYSMKKDFRHRSRHPLNNWCTRDLTLFINSVQVKALETFYKTIAPKTQSEISA